MCVCVCVYHSLGSWPGSGTRSREIEYVFVVYDREMGEGRMLFLACPKETAEQLERSLLH